MDDHCNACAGTISSFKSAHDNVAFLVSLGGATLGDGMTNYNWQEQSGDCGNWVSAAANSIGQLMRHYNLAGKLSLSSGSWHASEHSKAAVGMTAAITVPPGLLQTQTSWHHTASAWPELSIYALMSQCRESQAQVIGGQCHQCDR